MPAIVDYDAPKEDGPLSIFESGPILIHLAERTGRFMPQSRRGRKECLEWLFWQVGNLGPMAGQLSHFVNYAQGEHHSSHKRYANEYNRCLGILNAARRTRVHPRRLLDRRHGELARGPDRQAARSAARRIPERRPLRETISSALQSRPASISARSCRRSAPPSDEERRVLFNQTARDVLRQQ